MSLLRSKSLLLLAALTLAAWLLPTEELGALLRWLLLAHAALILLSALLPPVRHRQAGIDVQTALASAVSLLITLACAATAAVRFSIALTPFLSTPLLAVSPASPAVPMGWVSK